MLFTSYALVIRKLRELHNFERKTRHKVKQLFMMNTIIIETLFQILITVSKHQIQCQ